MLYCLKIRYGFPRAYASTLNGRYRTGKIAACFIIKTFYHPRCKSSVEYISGTIGIHSIYRKCRITFCFLSQIKNTAIFAVEEAKNNKFPGAKKPTVAFFAWG